MTPQGSTGETLERNSPALVNVAYNSTLTWADPVLTELERQVIIPLFSEFPVEMGVTGHEEEVLARLQAIGATRSFLPPRIPLRRRRSTITTWYRRWPASCAA